MGATGSCGSRFLRCSLFCDAHSALALNIVQGNHGPQGSANNDTTLRGE